MFVPVGPNPLTYTLIRQWQIKFFIPSCLCIINHSLTLCFLSFLFVIPPLYMIHINVIVLFFINSIVNKIIFCIKFVCHRFFTLLKIILLSFIFLCILFLFFPTIQLICVIYYYCTSLYLFARIKLV